MEAPSIQSSTSVVECAQVSYASSGSHKNSSRFTVVLETAWSQLRGMIPGLPAVVLLVLSAREYRRRGHFATEAWRKRRDRDLLHEVAVHPGMFECPEDLLLTILHEAAHAVLGEGRRVGDHHCCGVSLTGYYHRKEFRDAAEQLGLAVHFWNRRYGFSVTTGRPPGLRHGIGAFWGPEPVRARGFAAALRPSGPGGSQGAGSLGCPHVRLLPAKASALSPARASTRRCHLRRLR